MRIELLYRPGNTVARVQMTSGEALTVEAGSMIAMDSHLRISTTTHEKGSGNFFRAAKRAISGESFFLNHFECDQPDGTLWLGTALAGDMTVVELHQERIIVQSGSFVASTPGIDMDMSWQGLKNLVSGEALLWLQLHGSGSVVLSAFGAVYPVEVDGEYIVDSGHIVAFSETLDFDISKAGRSWLHSFLGGEGLVCRFRGHGTVWCQSHNPRAFGALIGPRLKARRL